MDEVLARLAGLSPEKLREEIISAGLKCGPITATTRTLFEKKLARAIVQEQEGDSNSSSSNQVQVDSSSGAPQTGSEERDPLKEGVQSYGSAVEEPSSQPDGQSPSSDAEGSPKFYYGVCPPQEEGSPQNDKVHVFVSKKEALKAVRLMKGSRFKAFSSRDEAEEFAKGIRDYCPSPTKPAPDISAPLGTEATSKERANSFQTPRTQDLTSKLRKAVEKGDQSAFSELVWSNPRYLIGPGDNPTVVQEGCRYNVLHVAAKENRPEMAHLILETLESPEFMRLMYPDDQEAMLHQRIRYIVDLYLNTPDKGSCETPLHFACKFGCPEVVDVLCSHPDTDKHCKNKYGQKPSSVICERKNKTQEVKQKIKGYLDDRCYVPLLRATDNSSQPVIGAPWSPEPSENIPDSLVPSLTGSPKDPVMEVRAFAGPFSPLKAEEFRRMWKTPPRDRAGHFSYILKSDPERGVERVGRELAHELNLPWAEYWEFLDCFVDLASGEGLQRLEEHLNSRAICEPEPEPGDPFRTPTTGRSVSVGASKEEEEADSGVEMKRQNTPLLGQEGAPESHTPPLEVRSNHINEVGTPNEPGQTPYLKPRPSPVSNLMVEFERMSTLGVALGQSEALDPRTLNGSSGAEGRSELAATDGPQAEGATNERTEGEGEGEVDDRCSTSSEEYFTADESSEGGDSDTEAQDSGIGVRTHSLSRDRRSSSGSSCSSYKSTGKEPEDGTLKTQPHSYKGLFIEGDSPSRLDTEVLMAVEAVELDPQRYPSIHRWKASVTLYPPSERLSWPSPVKVKSSADAPTTPAKFSPAPYSPTHASFVHRLRHMHYSDRPV